ncbi:protein of unknown function [Paraburkholderia kururiensis]
MRSRPDGDTVEKKHVRLHRHVTILVMNRLFEVIWQYITIRNRISFYCYLARDARN